MDASKISIKFWWAKAKHVAGRFLAIFKKIELNHEEIDKKLVYSLSPRKVPNRGQIKHLPKFLNPREALILKVCAAVILISFSYIVFLFFKNNVHQYPVSGGTYIEAVIAYPKNLNPIYSSARDIDADLSRLVYSSLFVYGQDGRLQPDLLTELEISEDHKEYLIKINDQARWHDGEPVTAEDVIFTIEAIQHPSFNSPLRSALSIASVEKVDDFSLRFKLSEAHAPFLEFLTFGIMPKHLWRNISPEGAMLSDLNLKPVGSGPYRFKSLIKSSGGEIREYNLEVNNNYYGDIPYISNLQFKFYPDYEEALRAVNSKQVDGLSHLPFERRGELTVKSSLNFHELIQARLVALFFNSTKNNALNDKDLRLALAHALDKEKIIQDVFEGAYQRADGPIASFNWAYKNDLPIYNYDPEAVGDKLSAGPLKAVLTVVDFSKNVEVAQLIKNYWEAQGAEISLQIISGEQAQDVIKNRDFEILLYGQFIGGDPDLYAFWHSSQRGSSGLNLANYNNAEVDKLLNEARVTAKEEERLAKYQEFQEAVVNDLPAIFLYNPSYSYIQSNKVKGFSGQTMIIPSDRFSSISSWYIKTGRSLSSDF